MKRSLLTLLLALSLGVCAAWAESTTSTISFGSNPGALSSLIVDNNITISFIKDNGSTEPAWNSGKHVRFYGGNKMTVSAKDAIISQVVFNTVSSRPFKTAATATTGILTIDSDTKTTWKQANVNDEISSFSISNGTSSGTAQVQITSIEVTYEISSNSPNLSYPSQNVRINLGETVVNDLINPYNVTVVYDSSNKDVATVNDDGSVNVLGAGSTIISASSQENEEYEAGYASYKLTIKDPNAPKFGLVTSVDELYDGAMALIVCKTKNDAMSTTQNSNNRGVAAVQIVDNEIDPSDEVAIVRLEKIGDKYALYVTNGEGTGYLYHPAGNSNYLKVQEQVAEATISFTDADDVEIGFDGSYKIKRNSSSTIYSCYTSAQTPIQLYVQPDPRKNLSISFDKKEYETLVGESFDGATLSGELPDGISVAYSSSDTEIATVDETTGVVTALKAGKVTITATTGKTADYNSASASYTLIVRKSGTPEISPLSVEVEAEGTLAVGPEDFIADVKNFNISSSEEDVLMVELEDGAWSYMAVEEGNVTLTATWDAGEVYAAGTKEFEFSVTPLGPLASPVFTPESGTYELSEIVTIKASAGAKIYYGVGTTKEEATEVYAEDFMLETLGEVTYVAYAKKGDRESDIVTVTYNVVKNDVEFDFEQSEYTVKMGTLPSELPVPSAKLNYTLTSSNTSVASLDPVIGAELWLLAPGDTEITATYAGNETTNPATAKYILHVIEEGVPAVDASVTFNFKDVKEEKYGLENAELETRNNEYYFKSGATAKNGDVTIILNKKANTSGWRIYNDNDLRIYTSSDASMTISVGSGIITSVDFNEVNSGTIKDYTVNGGATVTPSPTTRFTVDCTGLNTGTIIFTPTVGKNGVIGNVTVHYTIPAIPAAHTSANLAMEGEREVLADAVTTIEGAVVAPDVDQNVVNYLILNEEGASLDDEFIISNETGNDISVLTDAELGEYRLVAYIEPSDVYYPAIVEVPLYVREVIMPAELYLHGHFYNRYYDLTAPVKMEKSGRDFVATDILIGGNPEHAGDAYDYVFTTHKLDRAAAESSMMRVTAAAGSHQWDVLTEGTVYHNENDGTLTATEASAVTSAADITPINAGKEGLYQITVNFDDPKTPTYKAVFTDITTGIEGVTVDKSAEAVYYDLTGRRVANPLAGVFIRVQGGKAEKIMIK